MATHDWSLFLADSEATERFGARLGGCCMPGTVIHLHGELGAGKSTLVRGLLQGLGHPGAVKSPTYTLVEGYELDGQRYYHFDLYRLGDPEELEYLGIRDYFDGQAIALLEWPERGIGLLPPADLELWLDYHDPGRRLRLAGTGDRAAAIVECVSGYY